MKAWSNILFKNYYWAVKYYNIDKLKTDTLMKLKANSHELFQSNSDELMYFQAITILYDSKKLWVMSSEKFHCWLQQVIKFDESICAQIMTIIYNNVFWNSLTKFAFILYEQKHFQWFLMKKIINSKFNIICLFVFFNCSNLIWIRFEQKK